MMWPEVVVGDRTGEYFADPDQARIIHERLAHLTSDELVRDESNLSFLFSFMKSWEPYQFARNLE